MSQYKTGTVSVTNGSQVVTGTGTAWLSNVQPGDGFSTAGSGVPYTVGSVDSDTQITLSANYAGNSASSLSYAIWRDFTANENLPELFHGDIETATIWTRALRLIDSLVGAATTTRRGTVEKATTAEAQSAVADKFPDAEGVHAALNKYGVGDLGSITDLDLNDTRTRNAAFPTTASPNPDGVRSGSLIHLSLNDTVAQQLAIGENSDGVYFRRRRLSSWNPWRYLFHNANILGTVSQSGGIPNGAIIERGLNSNGEYVKFADGTLICSAILQINYDTVDRLRVDWTYPAAFVDVPKWNANLVGYDDAGASNFNLANRTFVNTIGELTVSCPSSTGASASIALTVYRPSETANFASGDFANITANAIGRWF